MPRNTTRQGAGTRSLLILTRRALIFEMFVKWLPACGPKVSMQPLRKEPHIRHKPPPLQPNTRRILRATMRPGHRTKRLTIQKPRLRLSQLPIDVQLGPITEPADTCDQFSLMLTVLRACDVSLFPGHGSHASRHRAAAHCVASSMHPKLPLRYREPGRRTRLRGQHPHR